MRTFGFVMALLCCFSAGLNIGVGNYVVGVVLVALALLNAVLAADA